MKHISKLFFALFFLLLGIGASAQYCTPTYSSGCIYGDGLTYFQLGTITQTISCTGSPSYYHYYNTVGASLQTGVNYTVTVRGGYGGEYVRIWIDRNRNNVFDPATETMASIICNTAGVNYTATINVPTSGTVSGLTRLRAMTEWISYPGGPCTSQTYGNCSDFPVSLTPYCIPAYSSGCTFGDGLTSFALGTISQPITCTAPPISYYHDFTNNASGTTTMNTGVAYTMTVIAGYSSTRVRVWVDLNNNNLFEAGEILVNDLNCVSSGVPYTATVTIPGGTSAGNHTLRFRTNWASVPSDPCASLSYGNAGDFTINVISQPPPTVTTVAASNIAGTTATLNGTVNANGAVTNVFFDYGLTPAFGTTVAGVPATVSGSTPTAVLANISGLTQGTLYYFRCRGVNSGGTTNGSTLSFTTALPPTATTNPATNVQLFSAQLNGTVNANNASSTVSFEWGLTTSYGNTIAGVPGTVTGNTPTAVLANLTGLTIATTYHYRVKAVNVAGTTYGLDQSFYTCVNPDPAGPITGPTNVCKGAIGVVYTVGIINNAIVYNWNVPPGATITSGFGTNTITVNFSMSASSGAVSVYGSSVCGTGTPSSLTVTVNNLPVPTITGPATSCAGASGVVYSTQGGNTNYVWGISAGGTITSGAGTSSITVTWNTAGAQNVSVNYTNPAGCAAQAPTTYPVTVNVAPVPTITGPTGMCVNSGYYTYTTEAGKSGYQWTVSSGGSIVYGQSTNQVTVNWTVAGAQWVAVNYSNSFGCFAPSPTSFPVSVEDYPGAAGTISGTSDLCVPAAGISYSVAPIPGASAYIWTLPAGATITNGELTNSITVDFSGTASSGNITVYGNSLCGNGTVSPPFPVMLTPYPDAPDIVLSSDTLYSDAPAGNQWYQDGMPIPGATDDYYLVTVTGNYWADVTIDGCTSPESNHIYVLITGTGDLMGGRVVAVYPNPSTGQFTLLVNSIQAESFDVTVYSSIGIPVLHFDDFAVNGLVKKNIDLSGQPGGVYTLILRNDQAQIMRKVVLNR